MPSTETDRLGGHGLRFGEALALDSQNAAGTHTYSVAKILRGYRYLLEHFYYQAREVIRGLASVMECLFPSKVCAALMAPIDTNSRMLLCIGQPVLTRLYLAFRFPSREDNYRQR